MKIVIRCYSSSNEKLPASTFRTIDRETMTDAETGQPFTEEVAKTWIIDDTTQRYSRAFFTGLVDVFDCDDPCFNHKEYDCIGKHGSLFRYIKR